MKKAFGVALLALPLLTASVHAQMKMFGPYGGQRFTFQFEGSFRAHGGTGNAMQAGPWYLYWPYEAHFNAPAPTGYPYWPPPQMLVTQAAIGGPAAPPCPMPYLPPQAAPAAPAPAANPVAAPAVQPTSYYQAMPISYSGPYIGQAPSYWYDR